MTVIVEGSSRTVPAGTTAAEVLNAGKDVLAARVDGRLVDLSAPVPEGAVVEAVTFYPRRAVRSTGIPRLI